MQAMDLFRQVAKQTLSLWAEVLNAPLLVKDDYTVWLGEETRRAPGPYPVECSWR
jgi:hypothetical protein